MAAALRERLSRSLAARGMDICVPFHLGRYNETAPDRARVPAARFPGGEDTLGFLFGNSRDMWERFIEQCSADELLLTGPNPLDTYVKQSVTSSVEEAMPEMTTKMYWGNDKHSDLEGGEGYISVQNLASAVGLCYLDKNSHLCIHPKFGSWFSLRGFLLVEEITYVPGKDDYRTLPNPLTTEQEQVVAKALQEALRPADDSDTGATYQGVKEKWRKWLAVRTGLHDGLHPWQYGEDQIVYHYTSNRDVLVHCVSMLKRQEILS